MSLCNSVSVQGGERDWKNLILRHAIKGSIHNSSRGGSMVISKFFPCNFWSPMLFVVIFFWPFVMWYHANYKRKLLWPLLKCLIQVILHLCIFNPILWHWWCMTSCLPIIVSLTLYKNACTEFYCNSLINGLPIRNHFQ